MEGQMNDDNEVLCPLHHVLYWRNFGCSRCLRRACELLEQLLRECDRIDLETTGSPNHE